MIARADRMPYPWAAWLGYGICAALIVVAIVWNPRPGWVTFGGYLLTAPAYLLIGVQGTLDKRPAARVARQRRQRTGAPRGTVH